MIAEVTYYSFFNIPILGWLGLFSFLSFSFTALIAILNRRGIRFLPLNWHYRMAYTSLIIAAIHGLLAFLTFL